MAMTKIFEQFQSGGTAAFLITDTQDIDIGFDGDLKDAVEGATQTVSITKLHWTTSGSIQIDDGTTNFTLSGNGAWCQFNGWTPVDISDDIDVTITGTGSLFIEIKKLAGYKHRNDYSNAAI